MTSKNIYKLDPRKVEEILRHYSPEAQTVKAIEELSELTTELARLLNNQGNGKDMMMELADVIIMIAQIMVIYDIDPEDLDSWIEFKLNRQIQRIRKEEENE